MVILFQQEYHWLNESCIDSGRYIIAVYLSPKCLIVLLAQLSREPPALLRRTYDLTTDNEISYQNAETTIPEDPLYLQRQSATSFDWQISVSTGRTEYLVNKFLSNVVILI